jgi:23S rRNA pseudouridine1911/1915/1917 synthase
LLQHLVPGASNRTLRQMLDRGRVALNGEFCRRANQPVRSGDVVEIDERTAPRKLGRGLHILHEDDDILVIEKPTGLLTVATADEREQTVYALLRDYLRASSPRSRLFIVHRLDKFASGVLVFAKSQQVKARLQALFKRHDVRRKYWAIVEGLVRAPKGTIRSYLAEDRSLRMHSTEEANAGKLAITHFHVLRRLRTATALEVRLETGRKNQIRAHLSEMGHPILGDRAYGSTQDPMRRLALHAFQLGFVHPTRKTAVLFETPPPSEFRKYLPRS